MVEQKAKSTVTPELLDRLRMQVRSNPQTATEVIDQLKAPDAAEVINDLPLEDAALTISMLPVEEAVALFNEPSLERRHEILAKFELERAAAILSEMSSDERADVVRRLEMKYREQVLPLLPESVQNEIKFLLQFPPTTAGGIMSTEFIRIGPDISVSEALNHIRAVSKRRLHFYSIYVLDEDGSLLGALSVRDLLVANPHSSIKQVMRRYPISVNCMDDQELVARKLAKYNLLAVPVVDDKGRVLGYVTVDDALDVLVEEHTEDVQKMGGMEALDEPYMTTPLFSLIRKRAGWLVVLFLSEMLTATAMGYFEDEIAKAVVLALFVPLIISSGGNSGSQAATLIIRALALGEVTLRDWWVVMRREIFSGLTLGTILGSIGFLRVAMWSVFTDVYGPHWLFIGVTIFLSLIGVVLWGTLSGSMLPFILKKLGFDPATSSAPFVATLVDVTGIVIYFTVAAFVLSGKLL
ncbi:MAG: magnesium transporter [Acidobacteriota bacterium]|nr:magnesium transporter [Blastocatellia bacterium]MDW8412441.1 magnesium transporter [Acidobacteriota bacterium]